MAGVETFVFKNNWFGRGGWYKNNLFCHFCWFPTPMKYVKGDSINSNNFSWNPMSSSEKKKLLKPLKITNFWPNLCKNVVPMGHTQNKKLFFFFCRDNKTISCFGWVKSYEYFSIFCDSFLLKSVISPAVTHTHTHIVIYTPNRILTSHWMYWAQYLSRIGLSTLPQAVTKTCL